MDSTPKENDVLLKFTRPADLPQDVPNTFIVEYLKKELEKKGNELISDKNILTNEFYKIKTPIASSSTTTTQSTTPSTTPSSTSNLNSSNSQNSQNSQNSGVSSVLSNASSAFSSILGGKKSKSKRRSTRKSAKKSIRRRR